MDKVFLESVLAEYKAKYVNVFRNFYPAMGSTGFPERNLSVNFSKAFETVAASRGYDVYSWFELQMRGNGKKYENGNKHCDALIVDNTNKTLYLIEAKRFTGKGKVSGVENDINRIRTFANEIQDGENDEFEMGRFDFFRTQHFRINGIILADVWTETKFKEGLLKKFASQEFLKNKLPDIPIYENLNFSDCANIDSASIKDKYNLLVIAYEVMRLK